MKITSAWAAIIIPIIAVIIAMYSDIQTLKVTKAEEKEMLELKVQFTGQMARNTVAIENLNETLKTVAMKLEGGVNGP